GPLLFVEHSEIVYTLFLGMLLANVLLLVIGLPAIRIFVKVLSIPKIFIAAIILVLSIVGSYAIGDNLFVVWVMLIVGLIRYFSKQNHYPPSPLSLGLILGPLIESNMRRILVISDGSWGIFITTPISAVLVALAVLTLFTPLVKMLLDK